MLGRLALAAGDTAAAGEHLAAAAGCFRDGDYLTELATTLADLADCAQAGGDLDAAERHAAEAITIAAPRGLVPAHSAALAARARIRAAQAAATADPDLLFQGRDAADAALRLAVRHHLAWHELDALRAHAPLDQAEGIDHGWAARADALHAQAGPAGAGPRPAGHRRTARRGREGRRGKQPGRRELMADTWTSVQIATLAVAALTPLTVAGLGLFVARASRRLEQVQWANQTVVTRRLDVFAQLAPGLNQLLCFATFVGGWKEIQPRQAIAVKRTLDEIMYANRVLFSEQLFAAYHQFMTTLFAMYASTDADALLRAPIDSVWGNRRNMSWWDEPSMAGLFTAASSIDDIRAAHDELAERFRADLYVTRQNQPLLATRP